MTKDWSSMAMPGVEVPAAESVTSYVTQGNVTYRALGDAVLCVHFTAAEGQAGGSDTTLGTVPLHTIAPPLPDSFEDLCLRAGLENAVIDLRTHRPEDAWLSERRVAKMGGYGDREAVWPKVVDALCFTRVMFPSDIAPDQLP
jgi:erythromycin esterase-like protein